MNVFAMMDTTVTALFVFLNVIATTFLNSATSMQIVLQHQADGNVHVIKVSDV